MTLITCQACGCAQVVQCGRFMCRPHWMGLPYPQRRLINVTLGKRQHACRELGVREAAPYVVAHVAACDEARRWTAVQEHRAADYAPDAGRIGRLYEIAGQTPPVRP